MEIKSRKTSWMDKSHPNYDRWNRSRDLAEARGRFVESVISQVRDCKDLRILDLGSGEGGTSRILAKNNIVVSSDFSLDRLKRQQSSCTEYSLVTSDALVIPFRNSSFDVIILQDVIEHIEGNIEHMASELYNLLNPGGVVFLSTPNKLSVINFLTDPHWGLPFVSVMERKNIRRFILPVFRKSDTGRKGIAQLLSYYELNDLFGKYFDIRLNTVFASRQLFSGNNAIVWSDLHLSIVRMLNKLKLSGLIQNFANDSHGIINKFLTPSFYLILLRK